VEHEDEPELLRAVNRLFLEERGQSFAMVKPALTSLIARLRAHMADEEANLFPTLERILAPREASLAEEPEAGPHVTGGMAVNRVLHEFPATQQVFNKLFVNVPLEGCDCLDEVAWRRGLLVRDLIGQLEGAIRTCSCAAPSRTRMPAPEEAQASLA
jgi:hypothetical protein